MALDNLTPEVWAGELLAATRSRLVYAQAGVSNTDYVGEISAFGDQVHIPSIGDPTVSTYTKNTNLSAVETLSDADQVLIIDQAKSVNFQVDAIDKKQNMADAMSEAVRRAGYQLAKAADTFMASKYTDISATNQTGTDASPITGGWGTAGTLMYDRLVDMKVQLDAADVDQEGRFAILPPWGHGYLLKDARFVGNGTAPNDDVLKNGSVGRAAGFDILVTNQVPNTAGSPATKYKIIAGHPSAWSFVPQIVESETFKPELRFGTGYKALYVFGGRVVRPYALALMTANAT